jgi:hypothetical protein
MTEKIICAGFGEQGIMAMGKILAMSALREGKFAPPLYFAKRSNGGSLGEAKYESSFMCK